MLKMVYFTLLCSLFFFGLTTAGQESFSMVNLHEPKPILLQALSHTGIPIAVSVSNEDLSGISSSVLMAESWLRTHVLTYFPATQITTIVVANNVVCNKSHEEIWGLVLPSMKNIYYSLVRWGLEKEIKVSTSFSEDCFKNPFLDRFRDDLTENVIKPLLDFLKSSNSTYSVNPPPDFFPLSEKTVRLVASHIESMNRLGFFKGIKVNVLSSSPKERKPMKRKLISSMASNVVDPFPARPTPLPEIPPSPLHHSIGYSVPAHVVKNPPPYLPPLFPQPSPSPSMSFSFPPELPPAPAFILSNPPPPPASIPSNPPPPASIPSIPPPYNSIPSSPPPSDYLPSDPPEIFTYPCTPPPTQTAPTPERGEEKGLWCVAKPTVPADTLQEAIDYACGEGGADCEEIKPNGSCYNPDTVVAHASYAFNSYWQKNKKSGGNCSFGGTAMIINADPSFQQCKFILSLD